MEWTQESINQNKRTIIMLKLSKKPLNCNRAL